MKPRPVLDWPTREELETLRSQQYRRDQLEPFLYGWAVHMTDPALHGKRNPGSYLLTQGVSHFFDYLDNLSGYTLSDRWVEFEKYWLSNIKGLNSSNINKRNTVFVAALTLRLVLPSAIFLQNCKPINWIELLLPPDAPLRIIVNELKDSLSKFPDISLSKSSKSRALNLGVVIILSNDYWSLNDFRTLDMIGEDTQLQKRFRDGANTLDAALCSAGVFDRTPLRGMLRKRKPRVAPSILQLVSEKKLKEGFQDVMVLYLTEYSNRVSSRYTTIRSRRDFLCRFWMFIQNEFPEISSCSQIRPVHIQAYIPFCRAQADAACRAGPSGVVSGEATMREVLAFLRTFFSDIALWSLEENSPFQSHTPPAPPLTYRETQTPEFTKLKKAREAGVTRRIMDLEREMPRIRALAHEEWQTSRNNLASLSDRLRFRNESISFWNWASLEFLLQSGLRLEEARRVTVFDILKRRDSKWKTYFLLHIAPSKFDKARLIPIGDSLGKVISEMIIHIKKYYGIDFVPPSDNFDFHTQQPLPRAPYLFQGRTRPEVIGRSTIRDSLAGLSKRAGSKHYDGTPLLISPHDCRRVFASEHLNNGTPPHVVRALLGHERLDTVMIYAKLYPQTLIEEYRRHVHGVYQSLYGEEGIKVPTEEDWAELERSCSLRDMGTHLCALPTGDHCPRGLVCLGCIHSQPKKTALPQFQTMRASHARELTRAELRGEPLGQLAARRLEIARLDQAIIRASELTTSVAEAMEAALLGEN